MLRTSRWSALNKTDLLRNPESARETIRQFSKAVAISALTGTGIQDLLHMVREELYESYSPVRVKLPYQQGALISLFHEMGRVEFVEHERGGVTIQGRLPGRLLAQFSPWLRNGKLMESERLIEDERMEEL